MFGRPRLALPPGEEVSFREFHLHSDTKQARLAIILFAVPLVGFAFNDYQLLGLSNEFYGFLALRLGLLFYTIFELNQIGKTKNYRKYATSITAYSFVLLICSGIINATRPQNFIVHVIITIIAIFVICVITPNRFVNQILLSFTTTIGEAAIIIWFQQPSSITYVFTIFLGLILANAIALSGSWQLQAYKRRNFQELTKNIELQHDLENHSKNLEKIVEEKTTELRKAERMATIGELAGMVGHDLRNPLSSIAGAVYYLKNKANSKLDEKEKNMLTSIQSSVDISNKIIGDLLDYSREIKLYRSETDPKSLLSEALNLLEVPQKITIVNKTEGEPKFAVDKDKMQRVFINLIKNAFDAMPNGGTLTIRSERIASNVSFVLEDTGIGMNEEDLKKLWTPLFTTKVRGMGLGLPICKRFVEAHKGTISVISVLNKGTTFVVNLPIKTEIDTK